jgi:serine protease Do
VRYLIILFAFLMPILATPAFAEASDIGAVSRSVVRIAVFSSEDGERKFIGHGSGVVVAPDKIVTNAHVVEAANYDGTLTFSIIPSEGSKSYEARLIKWSPNNDLALLQLSGGARMPVASLYTGTVDDGADMFAIGYPANVDVALEESETDMLHPQTPVKTRGAVSAGRSSKSFDSLLHTAPIAPGSSGGPLVDACGRVVGINSFGSNASEGGGAEFYFAVSVREVAAFLRAQNVSFIAATGECRSVAELTRAEAEREAAERAKIEAENRVSSELRSSTEGKIRREAELDIITSRENRIMLAALMLVLALGAGGVGFILHEREQRNPSIGAAMSGMALLLGALMVFLSRPSFDQVEERVRAALTKQAGNAGPKTAASTNINGKKSCVIQLDRSKVTVSSTADVDFDWTREGCVNRRTQYVENAGKWSRSFVPGQEAQVSMISYAPDTKIYRIERYQLGIDEIAKVREARNRYDVKGCTADPAAQEKISNMNNAVREVLPAQPNEMLVFSCSDQR